eukprot:1782671-Rhodomonas_salina.1
MSSTSCEEGIVAESLVNPDTSIWSTVQWYSSYAEEYHASGAMFGSCFTLPGTKRTPSQHCACRCTLRVPQYSEYRAPSTVMAASYTATSKTSCRMPRAPKGFDFAAGGGGKAHVAGPWRRGATG